jgi:hypothetical protein
MRKERDEVLRFDMHMKPAETKRMCALRLTFANDGACNLVAASGS